VEASGVEPEALLTLASYWLQLGLQVPDIELLEAADAAELLGFLPPATEGEDDLLIELASLLPIKLNEGLELLEDGC